MLVSLMSQNAVTKETQYKCRSCVSKVFRYTDYTPDAYVARYICKCVDSHGELSGPQFPLYKEEQ